LQPGFNGAGAGAIKRVRIQGHYDEDADIAWLRFEGYDSDRVVAKEVDLGSGNSTLMNDA